MAAQRGAPRLLFVVDQFEELFTLCMDSDERKAYLDNLLMVVTDESALTVILKDSLMISIYLDQFWLRRQENAT